MPINLISYSNELLIGILARLVLHKVLNSFNAIERERKRAVVFLKERGRGRASERDREFVSFVTTQ